MEEVTLVCRKCRVYLIIENITITVHCTGNIAFIRNVLNLNSMICHTENDSELKRPIGLYFFYCLLIQLNSDLLLPRDTQKFIEKL